MSIFNLQQFAEGATDISITESGTAEQTQEQQSVEGAEKSFSQTELDKILSSRLSKERAKWETDFKVKLETEKKEAQRLAKLSEEEKQKELLTKLQAERDDLTKQITKRELKDDVIKILGERKLSPSFADFLLEDDSEKTLARVNEFEKIFQSAVQESIKAFIPAWNPQSGVGIGENNPFAKETFNLTVGGQLYAKNPEKAKKLAAQAGYKLE